MGTVYVETTIPIANVNIRLELAKYNFTLGYKTPDICIPEELNKIITEE